MLIHHSGKDSTKGARGWSGLRAAADAEIEVVRANDDRAATFTKVKDGQDGAEFGFRLSPVVVGFDDDGDEITSCVLEHNAGGSPAIAKRTKQGNFADIVLRILRDDLSGEGVYERDLIDMVAAQIPGLSDDLPQRVKKARSTIIKMKKDGLLMDSGANIKEVAP